MKLRAAAPSEGHEHVETTERGHALVGVSGARGARRRGRRHEEGWQILALFLVTVVVTFAIVNIATAGAMAQIQIRRSAENTAIAQACDARLEEPAPDAEGGSLAPEPAQAGWSDVVFARRGGDRFEVLRDGDRAPEGAIVIRRQWRVRTVNGVRLFEVSGELAAFDGSRHPRADGTLRSGRRELLP